MFGTLGFGSSSAQSNPFATSNSAKANPFGTNSTNQSAFGSSGFGSSGFGKANADTKNSGFGSSGFGNSTFGNSAFGSSGFGNSGGATSTTTPNNTAAGSSGFGSSGFGGTGFGQSSFGTGGAKTSSNFGAFGGAAFGKSLNGASQQSTQLPFASLNQNSSHSLSIFQNLPANNTTTSSSNSAATAPLTTQSVFGNSGFSSSLGAFGTFGQPSTSTLSQNQPTNTSSPFGALSGTNSSQPAGFGNTNATTAFQSNQNGQSGQNSFGASSTVPSAFGASNQQSTKLSLGAFGQLNTSAVPFFSFTLNQNPNLLLLLLQQQVQLQQQQQPLFGASQNTTNVDNPFASSTKNNIEGVSLVQDSTKSSSDPRSARFDKLSDSLKQVYQAAFQANVFELKKVPDMAPPAAWC